MCFYGFICSFNCPKYPTDRLVKNSIEYFFLFIYLLVLPYYNTQNYYKNKNNIHDYIGRETATA